MKGLKEFNGNESDNIKNNDKGAHLLRGICRAPVKNDRA